MKSKGHLGLATVIIGGGLAVLAVNSATQAIAAPRGGGASSLNFSCDVIEAKCTCKGSQRGADCQAMLKNCREPIKIVYFPKEDKWGCYMGPQSSVRKRHPFWRFKTKKTPQVRGFKGKNTFSKRISR